MAANIITFSSELMKNYKQADIMAADQKFEALQTATGCSLLFSVGTDGVFYLTQETAGHSTGWERTDISSAQISKDFTEVGVACKTFDVAQNTKDGTIGVAMILADSSNDHLYLSLGNTNADVAWTNQPTCPWIAYPFDDTNHPLATIKFENIFISEASDGQYIVADVLRDTTSGLISRYYIDTKKTDGYAWHPHDLSIDLSSGKYESCLGRKAGQRIDGLYTFGEVNGLAQFQYQPLYSIFDPTLPPSPDLYTLPGNSIAESIAAVRNSDHSTDVYVTSQSGLYYLASTNQANGSQPVLLNNNSMFEGVTKLFALTSGSDVIVWGLNQADQIFYTSCPFGQQAVSSSWSIPVPILTGVEQVSPYINLVDNGNTFFAHTGVNQITKAIKSPLTSIWSFQQVTLSSPIITSPAQKFSSYTTRIQVTDTNNQPVANSILQISATTRATVYINNLYYVLDTTPIPITTDINGSITVVEWITKLTGTQLKISDNETNTTINPMEKPLKKATSLQTTDSLSSAVIKNADGTSTPLIAPDASRDALQQIATGNQQLATAYTSIAPAIDTVHPPVVSAMALPLPQSVSGFLSVEAGDLFRWVENEADAFVSLVKDAASDVWHFVAKIAGEVYSAVLDCVEKVVGALEWLYNVVKTAIEDLIKFLEFLFEWADITRTKNVIHNLTKLFLAHEINGLGEAKAKFNQMVASAQATVNNWAGITNWTGLGPAATLPVSASSTPASGSSASSSLFSYHMQHNISNATSTEPASLEGTTPLDSLLQALQQEEQVIEGVISQMQTLAQQYTSLSLSDVLEKLVAILANGVLDSAQVVIDALLDILFELATAALDVLDTPIYIPVLSDILSDFGVSSLSILDIFCWTGAVAFTLIYKAAQGEAPFPDDTNTNMLINVSDFQTVIDTYQPRTVQAIVPAAASVSSEGKTLAVAETSGEQDSSPSNDEPSYNEKTIFSAGHILGGICGVFNAFVGIFEASSAPNRDNTISRMATVAGVLGGVTVAWPNMLAPSIPIKNNTFSSIATSTSGARILNKLVMFGLGKKEMLSDSRKTGAQIDAALVVLNLTCTCWHFSELSHVSACNRKTQAILEETSNITQYIARTSYAVAVGSTPSDPIAVGIYSGALFCSAGLQIAEGWVDYDKYEG